MEKIKRTTQSKENEFTISYTSWETFYIHDNKTNESFRCFDRYEVIEYIFENAYFITHDEVEKVVCLMEGGAIKRITLMHSTEEFEGTEESD